jgi:energy-coupling factor transport system permease protein
VLVFIFLFINPFFIGISLCASVIYTLLLRGEQGLKICLCGSLPLFLLIAVMNPIFVHQGMVILFYINDNPVTLEAILFGFASAAMCAAVLLWFTCYDKVMTTDKFIYLFGRVIPKTALLISMTLRFVPRFRDRLIQISHAQKAIGMDAGTGSIIKRAKHGIRILSILITWSLESAVESADSMKARGYGLHGRTSFSIFRFERRDYILLAAFGIEIAVCTAGSIVGASFFQYYPYIKYAHTSVLLYIVMAAYTLLCLTPSALEIREDYRWRSLK